LLRKWAARRKRRRASDIRAPDSRFPIRPLAEQVDYIATRRIRNPAFDEKAGFLAFRPIPFSRVCLHRASNEKSALFLRSTRGVGTRG
jgi:hypothetical protein